MPRYISRFRPWLDDSGDWPDWELSQEEQRTFGKAGTEAAAVAAERLSNLYGEQARISGAIALVETLIPEVPPAEELQLAARAILAADCYHAHASVPQMRGGGATNPADGASWRVLRSYMVARAAAMLRDNLSDALLWRAIYGRIADNWEPQAQLTRALQQELSGSGLFSSVEVTLELNPPVAGGGRWIAMQTKGALAELRRRLQRREACLVELIRDTEIDHPAVNLVVAYRLEDELNVGRDGVTRVRVWAYDPRRGRTAISLRLTLADDRVQTVEIPAGDDLPSVKALRLVSLTPTPPPLFGWRRRLGFVLPWASFWSLKRTWLLWRSGERDLKAPDL